MSAHRHRRARASEVDVWPDFCGGTLRASLSVSPCWPPWCTSVQQRRRVWTTRKRSNSRPTWHRGNSGHLSSLRGSATHSCPSHSFSL